MILDSCEMVEIGDVEYASDGRKSFGLKKQLARGKQPRQPRNVHVEVEDIPSSE